MGVKWEEKGEGGKGWYPLQPVNSATGDATR